MNTEELENDFRPLSREDLGRSLEQHRARLKRLVELRLDQRVRGRVDASDVIQETQLEAIQRSNEYLDDPKVPIYVWLRFLTLQKVLQIHRRHLGTQARDVSREVSIFRNEVPAAKSAELAAQLVGQLTTASHAAVREEMKMRVATALQEIDVKYQDVLTLLHFEQLTQKEAAAVLDLTENAVGGRYVRALAKLRKLLS